MKIAENVYLYIIKNKMYYLPYEIDFDSKKLKEKKYRKKIEKEIIKYCFASETIPNTKKEQLKNISKDIKKSLIPFFIGAISLNILKDPVCNQIDSTIAEQVAKKSLAKISESELDVEEYQKLLTKLYNIVNDNTIEKNTYDILAENILLSNFDTKEEGFTYYALKSLEINPNFTLEEKNELKKEIEEKIFTFGKYYNGKRIITTLIEYANVGVKREYGISKATFTRDESFGYITYDPTWEDAIKALNHELSHAELSGEKIIPAYSEARAAFLSKEGYPKTRAFFTTLGFLGDDEKIIKYLINNDYDAIWENIIEQTDSQSVYKVNYIQGFLESIKEPGDLEVCWIRNPDIQNIALELYEEKYGFKALNVPAIYILNYIINHEYQYFKTNDNLVLNGTLPITITNFDISRTTTISTGKDYTMRDLENEELLILTSYLKEEMKTAEDFENTASFFIYKLLGEEDFKNFLQTEEPIKVIQKENIDRTELELREIYKEDINYIMNFFQIGGASLLAKDERYLSYLEGKQQEDILKLEFVKSKEM